MNIVLYHYWRSSCSWRVRWALALKGIVPEYVHVGLLDGEVEREPHRSRNPMGYVPALSLNGSMITESVAILELLDELKPSPLLYSGDAFQRAHIRALVETINAGTQPLQNLNTVDYFSNDPQKRLDWMRHFIKIGLRAFETLASKTSGDYCVGNHITAADLCLIPQCYNALRFNIDLSHEFKILWQIYQNAMATEHAQLTSPENFEPKP